MDCAYLVHTCTDMELLRDVSDFRLPCFVPVVMFFSVASRRSHWQQFAGMVTLGTIEIYQCCESLI